MRTIWELNTYELRIHQAHQLAEILQDVDTDQEVFVTTAGGDEQKLRGIPAIGRGVAGHIPGTSPHSIR